ncbi:MAG: MBOAT family protein [Lachnospiraceae bacterium]|nr:MBOAT family protein [Lachnospiraceae bacterium]
MLFNSYVFLFAFLPLVWVLYFGLNRMNLFTAAKLALILGSFVFYGYQNPMLCLLLLSSIAVNYAAHLLLSDVSRGARLRKGIMVSAVLFNFGLLFYFKYLDFTISNINFLTGSSFALQHIALPLGISFYTFQQVSFVVDSYKKEMGRYSLIDYALFVSFFPQLVAGPIVLHSEMIPQFADKSKKKIDFGNMVSGLEYLIIGLSKKVLLADSFGRLSDVGFGAVRQLNSLSAVAVMLAYTLEIYFDFSGYCDMAIGIGKLLNIDIPINFYSPYKACNISQFWKKWHMTLTRFLTTYLYIPLGGNRGKMWRTCLNVMIVFTLSGLWHGANWTFVVWGMLHGLAMVLYRIFRKQADAMPKWLGWLLTFAFVNGAWLFFRADNLLQPFKLVYMMVLGGFGGFTEGIVDSICEKNFLLVILDRYLNGPVMDILSQGMTALWIAVPLILCVKAPSSHEIVGRKCRSNGYFLWLALLLLWSVCKLSQVSKFIYFNF